MYLSEWNFSGIVLEDDMKYLLKRMLSFDPDKRISPKDICKFLSTEN